MSRPNLHLCDFDGTLYKENSLLQFLLFAVPTGRLLVGSLRLTFRFAGMFVKGTWVNASGKRLLLATFFKGKSQEEILRLGAEFARKSIPPALLPELLHTLQSARAAGDRVVIVSASLSWWLKPFSDSQEFDLLCTEMAFSNGIFNGEYALPNCNREEKVRRITAAYTLSEYEKVIAYGNPGGDDAMFELADEAFRF